MAKQTKKRANRRQTARKSRPSGAGRSRKAPAGSGADTAKSDTKTAQVIAMLQSPNGATIADMMQTTGWQAHSVRGFLAGTVRRKLKLDLQSTKVDGQRVYRVPVNEPASTAARSPKRGQA